MSATRPGGLGLSAQARLTLAVAVERQADLRGAAIVFCKRGTCELLRPAPVGAGSRPVVVFEVTAGPPSPTPRAVSPARKSKIGWELFQLGLNCGGTALFAAGTVFFSAAAAPTGGLSSVAAYASGAATVAGAVHGLGLPRL
ncbi:MAG: hypothetical protein JWP20_696 [Roseomonas sp.]|nr:hypothetical protein [Roseomonas sp.]